MAANLKKLAASAGIIAAIAAFTSPFEGLRTKAYPDPANPKIATICYGETQGVHFGDTKSPAECLEMLKTRLPDYLGPIDKQLPNLPDNRRIAYADAAYNLGAGILTRRAVGGDGMPIPGTSIVDLERSGKWSEACRRLQLFDRAGGKQLPGLMRRRQAESSLCLEDWGSAQVAKTEAK